VVISLVAMAPAEKDPAMKYHTPEEIASFSSHSLPPLDSGQFFHLPEACQGCHGFDSLGLANINANGEDVNLYSDWQTSMMALSAVDPLWRAKVSHEIQVNPGHSNELQTLCTSCHAPMGHYTAQYLGQQHYTLADLVNDSLGQSGVACMGCHSIGPNGLGSMFTGNIPYDTSHVAYGPFFNPFVGPMQLYVGLTPTYSFHVSEGRMCSPCHTLITNAVDLNGNPTGTIFVEQATFQEWQNSSYPDNEITCQKCHMPQIQDPIKIANGYTALAPRTPFNLHSFAGANSFMVNLIKTNKTSLGVDAPDADFDSTLSQINLQLTQNSTNVNMQLDSITADTAFISVQILNKAGHKFPSGYPSRRAVLQMLVKNNNGDTLFASGTFDSNMEVIGLNPTWEPHYEMINDPSQAQIYELVMGDVNSNRTTVLERGFTALKDNRIPPQGFTTTHTNYDTCFIAGNATTDPDFNKVNGVEGSGADVVKYHIPLNGFNGTIQASAALYYQTLPPSFLDEMVNFSSAEIDSFLLYFNAADKSVIKTGEDTLLNINIPTSVSNYTTELFQAFPAYTANGVVQLKGLPLNEYSINIYNSEGKLISSINESFNTSSIIRLPVNSGVYYISLNYAGKRKTVKVFRQ